MAVKIPKKIAAQNDTSVSALFSQYITSLAEPGEKPQLTPQVKKASGMVKLDDSKTDKELLAVALKGKYQ